MATFWAFLRALPELIELVRKIQAAQEEAATKRHVAEDVKTIHEAFDAKDASKLNALFRSS